MKFIVFSKKCPFMKNEPEISGFNIKTNIHINIYVIVFTCSLITFFKIIFRYLTLELLKDFLIEELLNNRKSIDHRKA